jgi:diaminohydroxyphosphoribosylaminopyrimidine deaminase/5-amino-6-(5-phosphoribosylamino)uracil reductase
MSPKKNNLNQKDHQYMDLAINLAKDRLGLTGLNPSVGCIILKDDEIISTGQTGLNGRPHAEYNAIKNNKRKIQGSTLYTTMEPCTHYGATPPCTSEILKSKIKKVIYAIEDIDNRTSKKAYPLLKSKKIIVRKNLLKNKAIKLYRKYFYHKKNKLPYVIGKIACSKDKFIFSDKKTITNEHSKKVSHLLRYQNQGILISSRTLNIDNPKLDCRINGLKNYSPTRFILDKDLNFKVNSYLINNSKKIKTIFFYNKINKQKLKILKKNRILSFRLKLNSEKQFNLIELLNKIYQFGITSLLVEGGKTLTEIFLKKKLFNEFYLFQSSKNLNNKGKIKISNIIKKLLITFKNKKNIDTYLDKDQLIYYY